MRAEGLDVLGICVVEPPVRRLRTIVIRRSPAGVAYRVGRAGCRWTSLSGFPRCCWSISVMRALARSEPSLTGRAPAEGFRGISLGQISVSQLSIFVLYPASEKLEVPCVSVPEHQSSQGHVPRRCLEDARAVLCLFSMERLEHKICIRGPSRLGGIHSKEKAWFIVLQVWELYTRSVSKYGVVVVFQSFNRIGYPFLKTYNPCESCISSHLLSHYWQKTNIIVFELF